MLRETASRPIAGGKRASSTSSGVSAMNAGAESVRATDSKNVPRINSSMVRPPDHCKNASSAATMSANKDVTEINRRRSTMSANAPA
ncbi:MAG: hypothetical protein EB050_07795 [Actinobacteria bacterium]|nr:hypothetical protein [Actinomycetota bacterium]